MSVLLFHASTAPFVQQAAGALCEAGLLDRFYTAIRNDPDSLWQKGACAAARLGGFDLRAQLRRRTVTSVPPNLVTAYPVRELIRLAIGSMDRGARLADLVWAWAEPGFDRKIARRLHAGLRAVYGFEYGSLSTFQAARARGMKVIYDVPAPEPLFVRAMLNREVAKFPELDTPYHRHTEAREEPRIARRRAEWNAADLVITASEFTRKTYAAAGLDCARARVVPYGAPPPALRSEALDGSAPNGPLQVLWAGTFSVRKGAHYMLEAWRNGGFGRHARLLVHGSIALPERLLKPRLEGVEFGGSIPQERLMNAYRRSDILAFPTLCDGFGMVATEAWSRGLPVLTTDCAGASQFLKPGENGLLVPAANAEAIQGALAWCLDHRARLRAMREAALATAAAWQWADYRRLLVAAVRDCIR